MKKTIRIFWSILLVFAMFIPANVSAEEITVEPRALYVRCTKSFNSLTKISTGKAKLLKKFSEGAAPGSTLTVSKSYATTVTNNLSVSLLDDFLSLGYAVSYTAGVNIGWSMKNTTSRYRVLGLMVIYDTFSVKSYTYQGDGYCSVIDRGNIDVNKGWTFDLVD